MGEEVVNLIDSALAPPNPRKQCRGAELPGFSLLGLGYLARLAATGLGRDGIGGGGWPTQIPLFFTRNKLGGPSGAYSNYFN